MDLFGGGRESLMQALFSENVCENERIGSREGGGVRRTISYVDPPMYLQINRLLLLIKKKIKK